VNGVNVTLYSLANAAFAAAALPSFLLGPTINHSYKPYISSTACTNQLLIII